MSKPRNGFCSVSFVGDSFSGSRDPVSGVGVGLGAGEPSEK